MYPRRIIVWVWTDIIFPGGGRGACTRLPFSQWVCLLLKFLSIIHTHTTFLASQNKYKEYVPWSEYIKHIFKAQNQCKSTLDSAMAELYSDMYAKIYRLKSVNFSGNFIMRM